MTYRLDIPDEAFASAGRVSVDVNDGFIQADVRAWQDSAVPARAISPEAVAAIASAIDFSAVDLASPTYDAAKLAIKELRFAAADPIKRHYTLYPRSHWHWWALAGIAAATVAACAWF